MNGPRAQGCSHPRTDAHQHAQRAPRNNTKSVKVLVIACTGNTFGALAGRMDQEHVAHYAQFGAPK